MAWFASVMGAGILLLALSGIGLLSPVQDASYKLTAPIESGLRSLAQPLADIVTKYGDTRALTRENESLRAENERLNADIARLREEATQNDELQRLLDTKNSLANQQFLAASVVARDPSNLRQLIAINRGKSDGIKVGMPVVTEGNTLVGTISKVDGDNSWVTLVTDVDSGVSAILQESRAEGVVVGGYDRKLSMQFVEQNATVNEGDTVITSGLGGTYPKDLVIGRVTGVNGTPQELFRHVTVEPLASLSNLETVLVMTSFVPKQLTGP